MRRCDGTFLNSSPRVIVGTQTSVGVSPTHLPFMCGLWSAVVACKLLHSANLCTSAYSGYRTGGTITNFAGDCGDGVLRYVFLCGVNLSSDDDSSFLAFTSQTGNSNCWGDSWRYCSQQQVPIIFWIYKQIYWVSNFFLEAKKCFWNPAQN